MKMAPSGIAGASLDARVPGAVCLAYADEYASDR